MASSISRGKRLAAMVASPAVRDASASQSGTRSAGASASINRTTKINGTTVTVRSSMRGQAVAGPTSPAKTPAEIKAKPAPTAARVCIPPLAGSLSKSPSNGIMLHAPMATRTRLRVRARRGFMGGGRARKFIVARRPLDRSRDRLRDQGLSLTDPSAADAGPPAPLSLARGTSLPPFRPRSGGRSSAPGTSSAGSRSRR